MLKSAWRSDLLRKSFSSLAIKMLSALLGYLMFVFFARAMSLPSFGMFSYAFSLALFLSKVATLGQNQLILRELSLGDENKNDLYLFSFSTVGCFLFFTCVAVFSVGVVVGSTATVLASLLIPCMTLSEIFTSIHRAKGRIWRALAPRELVWRGLCTFIPFTLFSINIEVSLTHAVLITSGTLTAIVLVQIVKSSDFLFWRRLEGGGDWRRRWVEPSKNFWFITIITTGLPLVSPVILGFFEEPEAIGPYFAALKTAQLLSIVLVSVNLVISPMIAREYSSGNIENLKRICAVTVGVSTFVSMLTLMGMLFIGEELLELFGDGYSSAFSSLIILSVGYAVTTIFGSCGQLLQMTGHESYFLKAMFVSNLLGLIAMVIGIFYFGVIGSAVAVMINFIVWNSISWFWSLKKCGVDTSIFSVRYLMRRY